MCSGKPYRGGDPGAASVILLGIDTCGTPATLALARLSAGGTLDLLDKAELPGRSAAAMLIPALREMLLNGGKALHDLGALVVVDGPGSFTGIRIGLSTVKALAEALGLPVFAISRLQVLASLHHAAHAALDAGRGECFLGSYADQPDGSDRPIAPSESLSGEWLLTREELNNRLFGADLVVCEPDLAAAFPSAKVAAAPTAADALGVALVGIVTGEQTEIAGLAGRYLRRSDLYRTTQPVAL